MATHRHIDRICCGILALALAVTALFMGGEAWGIQAVSGAPGYEGRLFDRERVHTIDILMDDWDAFLDTCEQEEYTACALVIDGEAHRNVGIRAKGNTSLTTVAAYGNSRYSFKVEFDHYDSAHSYYGLDKLSLNNLIQDNTCMKDFLCYQLMGAFGVAAPLCSYVFITVNGEDWGLYLAVEGVEDAFMERCFDGDGALYKPDSLSFGGGRGNGGGFDPAILAEEGMPDFPGGTDQWAAPEAPDMSSPEGEGRAQPPGGMDQAAAPEAPDMSSPGGEGRAQPPGGMDQWAAPEAPDMSSPEGEGRAQPPGGMDQAAAPEAPDMSSPGRGERAQSPGGMGSSDVKLQYMDDDPDSYPNIFDNAKTDITAADKARLIAALRTLSGEDAAEAVDVDQVLRYFVVHGFVCNGDSYTGSMVHNYYLCERDGRLSMIPWDYNLAFGGFQSGSADSVINEPIDTPVTGGDLEDRPMVAWIFRSQAYTDLYHQLYAQFIEDFFDTGACQSLIDTTSALIAPYVARDPTKFCTEASFEAGVQALRTFCSLRAESVRGQLAGSIPSTSRGQAETGAALVDAGGLNLSDMGSMETAGGHGGGGRDEADAPRRPDTEGTAPAFAPAGSPAGSMDLQERPRDFQPPESGAGPGAGAPAAGVWAALGVSAAALTAGLLAVKRFRRRGGWR